MTDRWIQMLAALREAFPAETEVGELESFLADRGLDQQEIGEVLTRFFFDDARVGDGTARRLAGSPPRLTGSLRVQGPHERGRFTVDAWGYLTMLHESGVVAPFDFEQLVERALFHMDGRIGLPEIRALADEVGLDATSLGTDRTLLH